MKKNALAVVLVASGLALAGGAAPAHAAIQWDFSSGGSSMADGVSVSTTAWTANGLSGGDSLQSSTLVSDGSSGLGVTNGGEDGSSPNHSIDNSGQYDVMLFAFDEEISLSGVTKGWSDAYDSDISVLAYTGAGDPTTNGDLTNPVYADDNSTAGDSETFTSSGWEIVGNYEIAEDNTNEPINPGGISSAYWLIGAYNPEFGSCSGCDTNSEDYMKILALAGNIAIPPPPAAAVAEPSSLMLLALGLLAPAAMRRRREKRIAA